MKRRQDPKRPRPRPKHKDKYETKRDEKRWETTLSELARHFNGEEAER